jgi:aryl-alcohol dehydrogenase-like predicted oxidoreductase
MAIPWTDGVGILAPMETRSLGPTGPHVHPVGLGAMPLSIQGRPPEAEAVRVLLAAFEAGVSLVDTADAYCLDDRDVGHNERLIARALREWRGGPVVVATKGACIRPGGAWRVNGHPDHLKRACDASLRALGVDAIDVYQLHAPDDRVPFADSVGALAELRAAGKIRHVGLSNVTATQIQEAQTIVPIASVQNRCSPFHRAVWRDGVLAHCQRAGIAVLAYAPVGGHGSQGRTADDPTLNAVARRHVVSPFQVALAWLLAKSPVMLPIPGASRVTSAVDSAAAAHLVLDADDLVELDAAFPT